MYKPVPGGIHVMVSVLGDQDRCCVGQCLWCFCHGDQGRCCVGQCLWCFCHGDQGRCCEVLHLLVFFVMVICTGVA